MKQKCKVKIEKLKIYIKNIEKIKIKKIEDKK